MTGLSQDQVKTYLYRRRRVLKLKIRRILALVSKMRSVPFETENRDLVDLKNLDNLRFEFDHWGMQVWVMGQDEKKKMHRYKVESVDVMLSNCLDASSPRPS